MFFLCVSPFFFLRGASAVLYCCDSSRCDSSCLCSSSSPCVFGVVFSSDAPLVVCACLTLVLCVLDCLGPPRVGGG